MCALDTGILRFLFLFYFIFLKILFVFGRSGPRIQTFLPLNYAHKTKHQLECQGFSPLRLGSAFISLSLAKEKKCMGRQFGHSSEACIRNHLRLLFFILFENYLQNLGPSHTQEAARVGLHAL